MSGPAPSPPGSTATVERVEGSDWIAAPAMALAYFVGGKIGFLFQSPVVPQSVLWLPNSILLAVLLTTRPRRWPLLLAVTFPAQLLVGWQSHAPLESVSLLFLTNCADAALGAWLWRRLSPGDWRIEGLRGMLAFILVAATLPTLLVSFADAGLTVATGWSSDYWLAVQTRARANVLTNVIFVPTAVAALGLRRETIAGYWPRRVLEATALFGGLLATAWFAGSRPIGDVSGAALLYLPLGFLLLAALRFGVGLTGGALLALAYLMTWMAMRRMGWAASFSPTEIVPALQLQLLVIGVLVLCLAAVAQDRERTASALGVSERALHNSLSQVRELAGRVLTATESERTRVGRELHDGVGQQIAALGIALGALKRHLPDDVSIAGEVAELQRRASAAADDVRTVSHELHPAVLSHGGLVPALRDLAAQYERARIIDVELSITIGWELLPHDVALCAYRVTQEALRNVARHSYVSKARVTLVTTPRALDLLIIDEGRGFDAEQARFGGGLGLTSIEERVRIVGGTVRIDSAPGAGTRIAVTLPLEGAR